MHAPVLQNIAAVTKVLSANFTPIRLLPRMNSHVDVQLRTILEILATAVTAVWPFVGMTRQNVRIEVWKLNEPLLAYFTFVRTFACMGSSMLAKIRLGSKVFSALIALERLLARMNSRVNLQISKNGEVPATDLASVRLLTHMSSSVDVQRSQYY